jgi:peptidoglycan/LPS O-acetylase OafA/YrhL
VNTAAVPSTTVEARPRAATLHQPDARHAWADNLRVALIIGVIGAHVGTTYILDVDWYYAERTATAASEILLGAIVGIGLLFGMGLLFLVAGLYSGRSLAQKGPRQFALGRLWRLGLPLLFFVVVIDSLTDFAGYRGNGGSDGVIAYLKTWWREDADLSVMWFVAALLAFSLAYAAWRWLRPASQNGAEELGRAQLLRFGAFIVVGSFVVRLVWPFLSDSVLGLNLWEFPQMIALFALGALAAERGWLRNALPDRVWRDCGLAALAGGVLLLALAGAIGLAGDDDPFLGGLHPQALALPAVEAVIAVGMSVWTLEWFRRHWDYAGPFARGLGRASFAAYVVHAPVIVLLSVGLRSAPVAVELKFLVVFALGAAVAFGIGWLLSRVPLVSRIV